MEKLKNGCFTNGYFTLGDEGEIETNRFIRDGSELAKFMDKILEKCDDHPSVYCTGNVNRYFRNFKRVNRAEHGRGANECESILKYVGENCYIPSGNGFFLKCVNYISKKDFTKDYFEFIQSYRRRTHVMTRCRIPHFCERCKIDIGLYDVKSERIVPRAVEERNIYLYIHKKHYCVIWKKNRKDSLVNGVEKVEANFKYIENKINGDNLSQRLCYPYPELEIIDQLENVFVFDLETCNDQEFAETYAAGLFNVNRLRDKWDRGLTCKEIEIANKMFLINHVGILL